jgi:hypothetical protein
LFRFFCLFVHAVAQQAQRFANSSWQARNIKRFTVTFGKLPPFVRYGQPNYRTQYTGFNY